MTADAANLYPRHRDRISGSEAYVVRHFARQNGITPAQVHELIKKHGSNAAKLAKAAKELRTSFPHAATVPKLRSHQASPSEVTRSMPNGSPGLSVDPAIRHPNLPSELRATPQEPS
jgi:hypothetical protein